MCTVSFLPGRGGFLLAMNRDEKHTRAIALPLQPHLCGARLALYPREPDGGTWIGVNNAGLSFALINWYAKPQKKTGRISRGTLIPALLAAKNFRGLTLPRLARINPFRLIGVSPREKALKEWRWDGTTLQTMPLEWARHHWFSSGLDDAKANVVRDAAVTAALPAHGLEWLRELQRSHKPQRGAFSICMHRDDAATVSYTELAVTAQTARMRYTPGPPCAIKQGGAVTLTLQPR